MYRIDENTTYLDLKPRYAKKDRVLSVGFRSSYRCSFSLAESSLQLSSQMSMYALVKWVDNCSEETAKMLNEDYPILLSIQQAARKVGKSDKTIRRWIASGKLKAEKHGAGGYLIKRDDLTALSKHVTKEWHDQSELAKIGLQVTIMEGEIELLRALVDAQQGEIEELQRQVKKLTPKKAPAKKKTSTTRTATRRKRDDDLW